MAYVTPLERMDLEEATANGLKQGINQGIGLGQSELLLRLLQRKFGDLLETIINKITTATQGQLESWALNFVDAKTLGEVFR